jgi:UDP:flavonoid glycosyltransferase YjiC (YdhE family)
VPTIALWPIGVAPEFVGRHGIHAFGFIPPPRSADNNPDIPYEHCERKTLVFVSGTPGTTREWFQSFLGTSIQVCSRLERNGILLGGSGRTQVPDLPPFFSYRDHLPLGRVLKNAVAIVHHGGIGTAATAIEAGVAQLIVPRVFAQPHNAERLRRLGVCSVISPQNYSCPLAVSEIVRLLHDSSFIERAGILSAMSPPAEQRVRSVCEFLETERADKSRAPVDQAAAK